MPTYQYACTACDERLEAVQSFSDAPLTECPACAGALRKVFSAVGVVFKGSGFYKTDSRSAAKSGEGKNDKGEKAPAAASSDAGSGSSSTSSGDGASATPTSTKPAKAPAAAAPVSKSA